MWSYRVVMEHSYGGFFEIDDFEAAFSPRDLASGLMPLHWVEARNLSSLAY